MEGVSLHFSTPVLATTPVTTETLSRWPNLYKRNEGIPLSCYMRALSHSEPECILHLHAAASSSPKERLQYRNHNGPSFDNVCSKWLKEATMVNKVALVSVTNWKCSLFCLHPLVFSKLSPSVVAHNRKLRMCVHYRHWISKFNQKNTLSSLITNWVIHSKTFNHSFSLKVNDILQSYMWHPDLICFQKKLIRNFIICFSYLKEQHNVW